MFVVTKIVVVLLNDLNYPVGHGKSLKLFEIKSDMVKLL